MKRFANHFILGLINLTGVFNRDSVFTYSRRYVSTKRDICGLGRREAMGRLETNMLVQKEASQVSVFRGVAQTRNLSTSAHGCDSCRNATACLSVSVRGCVYLWVSAYASARARLPVHMTAWSACDPRASSSERQTHIFGVRALMSGGGKIKPENTRVNK